MKKLKKLIVGNWKMNPQTTDEAKHLATEIKRGLRTGTKSQVVICPPYVFLESLKNFPVKFLFLGSQDAFYETSGPHTGEVSYAELTDFKVDFVIVGHSERRAKGETDEIINKKLKSVVNSKMNAILCVGEKIRDTHGEYLSFIKKQIAEDLRDVSKKALSNLVIAYEPVWAIGAKVAMYPQEIHEMSIYIKKILRDMFGVFAEDVRILYGGAVDVSTAYDIVREGNVSGLLIGRESLKPKDFVQIIKLVDNI